MCSLPFCEFYRCGNRMRAAGGGCRSLGGCCFQPPTIGCPTLCAFQGWALGALRRAWAGLSKSQLVWGRRILLCKEHKDGTTSFFNSKPLRESRSSWFGIDHHIPVLDLDRIHRQFGLRIVLEL